MLHFKKHFDKFASPLNSPPSTVNYIAETKEIICFFLWIIKNAYLNDSNGEAWSYKYW